MDLDALLSTVASRPRKRGYGIGTKAAYWRDLDHCYQGGYCPSKVFKNAPSGADYERLVKQAERELVWSDSGQLIEKFGSASTIQTPGALADFDCVVSSFKKDRDGDRLNPKGGQLDPHAPLLWQHIPFEPVGKVCSGGLAGKFITAHCCIADTELGKDAATLTELGALRISHGFQPEEWEPLDDSEKGAGFLISKYEIMEVSLVSIPSNTDAVIDAFSRNKLHHPAVKQWAGTKFHKRTKRFNVAIDLALLANGQPIGTVSTDGKATTKSCTCTAEGAGCRTGKTTDAKHTKGVYAEFENSWTDIQSDLNDSLLAYLIPIGAADPDDACFIVDMFPDKAIVGVVDGGQSRCYSYGWDDLKYYLLSWAMGGDGEPAWSGAPQEHKITAEMKPVAERAFSTFGKSLTLKGVQAKRDVAKAPRDHEWDAGEARKRIAKWAGGPDKENVSWKKYARAFIYVDGDGGEFGKYKLPFCDVIDGDLKMVYKALVACKSVLDGGRGGVDIDDKSTALARVNSYLKEFGDESSDTEGGKSVELNKKGVYCKSIYLDIIKSAHHMVKAAAKHDDTGDEPKSLLNGASNHLDTAIKGIEKVSEAGGDDEDETPAGKSGKDAEMPVEKTAAPAAENVDAALDAAIALAFDGKFADLKKCERLLKSLTHYVTDAKLKHAEAECKRLFGAQA